MRNLSRGRSRVVCAGVVLTVCVGGAMGNITNQARVTLNPSFSGGGGPKDVIVTGAGVVDAQSSTTGGAGASGSGSAHTEYGMMRAISAADRPLNASGSGIIRDSLTITAPGVPQGTPGTLTFTVQVEGTLTAPSGFSRGSWQLSCDVGGAGYDLGKSGSFYSPETGQSGYVGDPMGVYSATITFQYGFAFPVDLELAASASSENTANSPGAAGAHMVFHWMGIGEVKAGGVTQTTYTVNSESGTDWTGYVSGVCPADFDGSGFVDTDDFDAFVAAFEGGEGTADVDGTGFVDTDDFDAFVHAFEVGC